MNLKFLSEHRYLMSTATVFVNELLACLDVLLCLLAGHQEILCHLHCLKAVVVHTHRGCLKGNVLYPGRVLLFVQLFRRLCLGVYDNYG